MLERHVVCNPHAPCRKVPDEEKWKEDPSSFPSLPAQAWRWLIWGQTRLCGGALGPLPLLSLVSRLGGH